MLQADWRASVDRLRGRYLELRYFLVPAIITLLMTGAATLVPTLRTARLSIASVLRHD